MWNVNRSKPMKKANVTYTAPPGHAKTAEIAGTTLVSGKADTVICDEATMKRLQNIRMLKVDGVSDYTPPPPKPEKDDKGKAA
jgi:hypothetical protein